MYGEGLLMMSALRSKHVELYTYRQKIKICHKLHLLFYLFEHQHSLTVSVFNVITDTVNLNSQQQIVYEIFFF
jgi:hypothetical protein